MISALSWVPKGASKSEPVMADPPSKEEIEEIINSSNLERSGNCEDEENDEDMDDDSNRQELDMDHYDDEDEGVELFSLGIGDLYYSSNEQDPYLQDKEMTILTSLKT
ncbi:hypothetical protein L6164_026902 [Bauhinia variegata]|uniref:Uncharacterized protein n=1 Tax=Bauhinia variegata TaxID=167791 RepID=A0ACB9LRQ9_BAUVA|nr:hypothetical protein L6164_026902 [Bauhinia variegata]